MKNTTAVIFTAILLSAFILVSNISSPNTISNVIAQEDITSVSGQSGWKIERTLEVSEGDTFAVVLYVQTGAGVYWSESFDSSFIAEARPKDYIKDNPPGTVGEYGRMLFTFKAVKKGTATIDFDYLSHTDGDSSRTVEITVHIR